MIFEIDDKSVDFDGENITHCELIARTNQGNVIKAYIKYGKQCETIDLDGFEFDYKDECITGIFLAINLEFVLLGDLFDIASHEFIELEQEYIDDIKE